MDSWLVVGHCAACRSDVIARPWCGPDRPPAYPSCGCGVAVDWDWEQSGVRGGQFPHADGTHHPDRKPGPRPDAAQRKQRGARSGKVKSKTKSLNSWRDHMPGCPTYDRNVRSLHNADYQPLTQDSKACSCAHLHAPLREKVSRQPVARARKVDLAGAPVLASSGTAFAWQEGDALAREARRDARCEATGGRVHARAYGNLYERGTRHRTNVGIPRRFMSRFPTPESARAALRAAVELALQRAA